MDWKMEDESDEYSILFKKKTSKSKSKETNLPSYCRSPKTYSWVEWIGRWKTKAVSIQFFLKKKLQNQRVKKLTYLPIVEVRRPVPGLNGLKDGKRKR